MTQSELKQARPSERESVVAMVVAVAVMTYPQCTVDAADDATRHPADDATHDPADRAEHAMADMAPFVRTFARALTNTLSLRRKRHCKNGEDTDSHYIASHYIARFHKRISLMDTGHPNNALLP